MEDAPGPTRATDPLRRRPGPLEREFARRLAGQHPATVPLAIGVAGYLVLAPILLAVGLVLDGPGTSPWLVDLDRGVADWFATHRNRYVDPVAQAASALTDPNTVLGLVAGAGSVLAVLRRWRALTVLLVAVQVELAAFVSVTFVVARPRPESAEGVLPITFGYPSGHAAMAVALYGSLVLVLISSAAGAPHRRLGAGAVMCVAVAVALSRLYLGLHYLTDVLVGLVLGAASLRVGVGAARALPVPGPPSTVDRAAERPA